MCSISSKKSQAWLHALRLAVAGSALAAASFLTGCTLYSAAMIRSQRVLTPRKAPSLEVLEKKEPLMSHQIRQAVSRTGLLLEHARVRQVTGTLTDRQMDFKLVWDNAGEGTLSSAVPITDDGYFLTAAHCVNRDSLTLLAFDVKRKLINLPARVVWQGDGLDLALVHAAMRPLQPFPLVDPASLPADSRVVITGWSGIIKNTSPPMAAGKLGQVSQWHRLASGAVWREVEHDAPLNQGDSGGPLLTLNGHLVGINSQLQFAGMSMFRALCGPLGRLDQPMAGYNGLAIFPDAAWIAELVRADRAMAH